MHASPATARRRLRRSATLAAACVAALCATAAPALAEDPQMTFDDALSVTPVCFSTGAAPGSTSPTSIYGRRFTDGPFNPLTPAIVLVHGIASSTETWDFTPTWSVARYLASAGYVVYAYDRLGYARSRYDVPGSGLAITSGVQQAVLHDVVTQVKNGGYRTTTGADCTSGTQDTGALSNRTVVVLGHSAGGWVVAGYPGRFQDVAAMIQTSIGATSAQKEGTDNVPPSQGGGFRPDPQRPDYFSFFQQRSQCEAFNLYPPNVVQSVVDVACAPPFLLSPFGEITGLAKTIADNDNYVRQIGPGTPVLLAAGDRDTTAPPSRMRGELTFYRQNCKCDVTLHEIQDTAHLYMAHRSLDGFLSFVVDWLSSKNLPPAPRTRTSPPASTPAATGTTTAPVAAAPAAVRKARRVTVRVTPSRDRSVPFRFATSGRVELYSGMASATFCRAGRVLVQVKSGTRTISARRTSLRADCTFRSSVSFALRSRLGSSGRLRFLVRFLGNPVLEPRSAAERTVRAGT